MRISAHLYISVLNDSVDSRDIKGVYFLIIRIAIEKSDELCGELDHEIVNRPDLEPAPVNAQKQA